MTRVRLQRPPACVALRPEHFPSTAALGQDELGEATPASPHCRGRLPRHFGERVHLHAPSDHRSIRVLGPGRAWHCPRSVAQELDVNFDPDATEWNSVASYGGCTRLTVEA